MRYAFGIVTSIFSGFFALALAQEFSWVLQTFAAIGILFIFGGATWIFAAHWNRKDELKFFERLQRLRNPSSSDSG